MLEINIPRQIFTHAQEVIAADPRAGALPPGVRKIAAEMATLAASQPIDGLHMLVSFTDAHMQNNPRAPLMQRLPLATFIGQRRSTLRDQGIQEKKINELTEGEYREMLAQRATLLHAEQMLGHDNSATIRMAGDLSAAIAVKLLQR